MKKLYTYYLYGTIKISAMLDYLMPERRWDRHKKFGFYNALNEIYNVTLSQCCEMAKMFINTNKTIPLFQTSNFIILSYAISLSELEAGIDEIIDQLKDTGTISNQNLFYRPCKDIPFNVYIITDLNNGYSDIINMHYRLGLKIQEIARIAERPTYIENKAARLLWSYIQLTNTIGKILYENNENT